MEFLMVLDFVHTTAIIHDDVYFRFVVGDTNAFNLDLLLPVRISPCGHDGDTSSGPLASFASSSYFSDAFISPSSSSSDMLVENLN